MNLTKLFNFKYLKQNFKKSKSLIILIILIIPVLTTLFLIGNNNSEYANMILEGDYNFINYIGMYILPIILSIVLLGYVYKRDAVDLINSMPINRKTIYFTNLIGGIVVILISQFLTMIAGIVCSKICLNIFLPVELVVDSFFVMLVSYIFVYTAACLALTVSGNIMIQCVVTALILFLIPFLNLTWQVLENTNDIFYMDFVYKEIPYQMYKTFSESTYTPPFRLLVNLFLRKTRILSNKYYYKNDSIIRYL